MTYDIEHFLGYICEPQERTDTTYIFTTWQAKSIPVNSRVYINGEKWICADNVDCTTCEEMDEGVFFVRITLVKQ